MDIALHTFNVIIVVAELSPVQEYEGLSLTNWSYLKDCYLWGEEDAYMIYLRCQCCLLQSDTKLLQSWIKDLPRSQQRRQGRMRKILSLRNLLSKPASNVMCRNHFWKRPMLFTLCGQKIWQGLNEGWNAWEASIILIKFDNQTWLFRMDSIVSIGWAVPCKTVADSCQFCAIWKALYCSSPWSSLRNKV